VGWDIEIMTQEELEKQIEKAVAGFCQIEGITEDLANQLVGEGYLSYDDLSVIEPEDLMAMGELTEEQVDNIVTTAEEFAEAAENSATELRSRNQADRAAANAKASQVVAAEDVAAATETGERGPSESTN
jgi:N utilization substance protein A